jgi:hypothetical protein
MKELAQQFSWGSLIEIKSKKHRAFLLKRHAQKPKVKINLGAREAQQQQPAEQTTG